LLPLEFLVDVEDLPWKARSNLLLGRRLRLRRLQDRCFLRITLHPLLGTSPDDGHDFRRKGGSFGPKPAQIDEEMIGPGGKNLGRRNDARDTNCHGPGGEIAS
jgi:hypothetical protein